MHVGRIPSHRIFLLRQRSQAWAIRLWELTPTLMTFIGSMPGILANMRINGHQACRMQSVISVLVECVSIACDSEPSYLDRGDGCAVSVVACLIQSYHVTRAVPRAL